MKRFFGRLSALGVAGLSISAYGQAMNQEMADKLNAMNDDQNIFEVLWFLILENWLLIIAALILLLVVLILMRRHDKLKAELDSAKASGSAVKAPETEKPADESNKEEEKK